MRKIKISHSNRDRVLCTCKPDKLTFYFQKKGSKQNEYLFEVKPYDSVWSYFENYGRWITDHTYSLTLGQLYRSGRKNDRLAHILNRIPVEIEYILMYGPSNWEYPVETCYKAAPTAEIHAA